MGKGTFTINWYTHDSVNITLVPDTVYESYRIVLVNEETTGEINDYGSALNRTITGLEASTTYDVNVIGQIDGHGDPDVGWWGMQSFTTQSGPKVYFEITDVGITSVAASFYDPDEIADYVRARIQTKNENNQWELIYTSPAVSIYYGEAEIEIDDSTILTPSTEYRFYGQRGVSTEYGTIRWYDAYQIDTNRIYETFTTRSGGLVHIYYNNQWHNAIPYIYTNGHWKQAIPYIYTGGHWKITI